MSHRRDQIWLRVVIGIIAICSDDISARYQVLQSEYLLWSIKRTHDLMWFHMSLVKWFSEYRTKIWSHHEMVYLAWGIHREKILFTGDTAAWFWLHWGDMLIVHDGIHICLDIMELSLESLISDSYPVKSGLKQYIHRIEKQWHIEYSIEHRDDLATYGVWNEITESDSRSRDHSEVERIEVVLSDRMSYLEIVYCKCPDDPRYDEYDTNRDEPTMVEMESHRKKYRDTNNWKRVYAKVVKNTKQICLSFFLCVWRYPSTMIVFYSLTIRIWWTIIQSGIVHRMLSHIYWYWYEHSTGDSWESVAIWVSISIS